MANLKRRKISRRVKKIWLSLWLTIAGTAVVSGLIVWREVQRDTDLQNPSAEISANAKTGDQIESPPIRFRDVADALGITMRHGPGKRGRLLPEDTGSGLAWGDYDADGDVDLFVVNFPGQSSDTSESSDAASGSNRLYRNDGEFFTDVTESAGVGDPAGIGMGATFADYDNDGHLDLYVTNWGPNRLFRNRGNGTFEEVAQQAGVDDSSWSAGVAWGDFDRDGHLDLYVCNYVEYDLTGFDPSQLPKSDFGTYQVPFTLNPNSFDPAPNRLYRNRGDGTFEDVAEQFGVSNPQGRSLAATFCDLDGDGWLDLYVNNDVSTNKLFRNMLGDVNEDEQDDITKFADISAITGTADPRGSMGLSVGEIGSMSGKTDGLPDMFITHWVAQENALYQSLRLPGGDLEYRDKTRQFRLGEISIDTVGWGTAMVDFDLDSRVDIVVANGSTLEQSDDLSRLTAEPLFLLWNAGKRFQNVAITAGKAASGKHNSRGLAAADFDNDGDIDLAVAINRSTPLLLLNETVTTNGFLKVTLHGPSSACFGAKVRITIGDQSQTRWYGCDVSFLSMHATDMIFGLGPNKKIDRLEVHWADGKESVLSDIKPGHIDVIHSE